MRATVTTIGDAIVVALVGSIDLASVGTLHGELGNVVRRHAGVSIIVDLDGIEALDDAGLGVLLGAAAAAREAGGDLQIVCNSSSLRDRLERTRFDRAITIRTAIV